MKWICDDCQICEPRHTELRVRRRTDATMSSSLVRRARDVAFKFASRAGSAGSLRGVPGTRASPLHSASAPYPPIFATRAFASQTSPASPSSPGLFEMRTYVMKPEWREAYLHVAQRALGPTGVLRKFHRGFLGSWVTNIGGDLNEVVSLYHYADYDEREDTRRRMSRDSEWGGFDIETRPMIRSHKSEIFLPATKALESAGIPDALEHMKKMADTSRVGTRDPGVYELRTYQLELGYNPIPKLMEHMSAGLPSKLKSDTAGLGELAWMGYSDVGKLNQFVELWRYPSFQDHIKVREAARGAGEWRECIGKIAPMVQMFDTRLVKPATFSPMQ